MDAYWYDVCPRCDGQGRLVIYQKRKDKRLFFCCDECEASWNSVAEIGDKKKVFSGFEVPSSKATLKVIEENGWGSFAKHLYVK